MDKFLFGAHQFLWKQHWTDDDLEILDGARALGLSVFEVSLGDDVSFTYQRLRRHAEELSLELSIGPGNAWPMVCDISHDDPGYRTLGVAWHKEILDRAAECGATAYCGAIYSHPGRVCRRPRSQDELQRAADNLFLLAEHAASLNIRLVIEPMSRFRSHLINTASEALDLLKLAGHENISINLDTYHMITEERNYETAITSVATWLWGLHACENDRGVPDGGLVPWDQVTAGLKKVTHPVRLLLETYRTGAAGFGPERGIFKNLCPDPEEFVRQGIRFLTSIVSDQ